jgi:hypothetical protein
MCLKVLKTPQVDRLSGPELPYDDPHHRVVGTCREVTVGRIAAEIDELANHVLNVGS